MPKVVAAQVEAGSAKLRALVARCWSRWSIMGIMVAMLGVAQEKKRVACFKSYEMVIKQ